MSTFVGIPINHMALRAALIAAARNDLRRHFNGVLVEVNNESKRRSHITLIGSDGFILAACRYGVMSEIPDQTLFIPRFVLSGVTDGTVYSSSTPGEFRLDTGKETRLFDGTNTTLSTWRAVVATEFDDKPVHVVPALLSRAQRITSLLGCGFPVFRGSGGVKSTWVGDDEIVIVMGLRDTAHDKLRAVPKWAMQNSAAA